ncbi:MAG: transcriptional regulator [Veillonella sp.]|nr:transcriptional regulator [Veillonella sp.]
MRESNVLEFKEADLYYDSLPSKVDNLTFNYLEQAFQAKLGIEKLTTDILITLQLLNQDKSYSIAGELLSDQNHYLGIDMVRFGDSINVFLDRTILDGCSLLEQFEVAVAKYRQYYQYEEIIGSERISKELIPEAAFREAIANALIHRDWQIPAQIKVAMHKDSIEISSPGGLVNGLSKEEYLTGQLSLLRNPILGAVFFRLHLIEKFGTGIQRIFASYEGSRIKPSVRILENSISITLPIYRESLESLSPDQRAVYGALESKPLSSSQIVSATGFGATKVRAILKGLIDAGYVEKHGNGRGTLYACV